jgi:hypothetical protein
MKINTRRLRRIIQEEISRLHESEFEMETVESFVARNIDTERLRNVITSGDVVLGGPEAVYDHLLLIIDDALNATMPSGRPDRRFVGGVEVFDEGRRRR